jgi:capsular exopolysaccharide synthesis family protein
MTDKYLNKTNKEKSLLEIINIVYQGRTKIIISVFLFLILAYLYNQFSTPIYESKALLKKEVGEKSGQKDEFSELVNLQTSDQLETEMELVKTNEVLRGVINELKLFVELKKVVDPKGNSWELNNVFIDFPDSGNNYAREMAFHLPIFKNFQLIDDYRELELYIKKISEKRFELWSVEENKLITSFNASSLSDLDTLKEYYVNSSQDSSQVMEKNQIVAAISTNFAKFDFSWNDAPVGSKIYFNIRNYLKFIVDFSKGINVSRVGHTDVFELNVRSSSPLASNIIANSIISHFRAVRMEQQKQMIRYSFHFVDEQLTQVQRKLLDAENNLSNFKASGEIMSIDSQTQEVLNYISTLEAEELQADLLLSNYKDKAEAMKKELEASGYFDQSFLELSGENQGNSPFSVLMTRLSDLEMQKLGLLQKRTANHPDVLSVDEQIRSVKDKLANYNQNTLTAYNIIITTLEKKLQKIRSLMSGYEVKMKQLPGQENTMARLIREKEVYEKIFNLLLNKREEMRVAELSKLQDIIIVDYPSSPVKPVQPRKFFNMLIALFLGGFLGIIFIFIIELKRTRLVNLDDLEREFNIPILALIPNYTKDIIKRIKSPKDNNDRFVALMNDNMGIRESYRLLKTKLYQLDIKEKTILVTSCEEHTGKTSLVANIAINMAQEGKNVLIIDCDLRKADLSSRFDISINSPGLIDFITSGVLPKIYTGVLKKINIIPAGGIREDSSSLLNSDRMKSLFKDIDKSAYDYIIIDTPPVTRVVDTLILGQYVKNAILVVRPDTTLKEVVIGGIKEMSQARIKILGLVANAAEIEKSSHYKYRYGYGYGYGYSNKENNGVKGISNTIRKSKTRISKIFKVSSN